MSTGISSPWLTEERAPWCQDVKSWISDELASLGLGYVGRFEPVRERRWSAVFRVTTPRVTAYFKAGAPGRQNEPRLLKVLRKTWNAHVPALLATDDSKSWILMADHGRSLADGASAADEVAAWECLLPEYAELQQSSGAQATQLIDQGLPDRRPLRLPALLDALLAGESTMGTSLPLESHELRAMERLLLPFAERCGELAATRFATGLDHGDLHSGNLLMRRDDLRLCDWGDASITHPFCSLLVTFQLSLRSVARAEKHAAARRLRQTYLEAWTTGMSGKSLESTFDTALWVGHIVRALDWAQLIEGADAAFAEKWRGHIADLLRKWAARHELIGRQDAMLQAIL